MRCLAGDEPLDGGEGRLGRVVVTEDSEARGPRTAIADEARRLQEALDGAETTEIRMIEVHYLLSRLRHDMQWLTGTAHRIERGGLVWP